MRIIIGVLLCTVLVSALRAETTELMWAAQKGNLLRIKKLIEDGADVNAVNSNNVSVLYHTTYQNRPEAARLLIQAGARPSTKLEHAEVDRMLSDAGLGTIDLIVKGGGSAPQSAPTVPETGSTNPPVAVLPSELIPKYIAAERSDDYAVIIGVEKYEDLPSATFAERDAKAARAFIRAMGVPERNIMTLTGSRATRTGLVKAFEAWLPNNVSEKSRVYVFYSGHGAPDAKTKQAYLVPSDGDPQYLAETGYPLERLYEKLGKLKAKHVLVALDSCFSGAGGRSVLAKGTRPLVGKVDMSAGSNPKLAVITASGGDQISGSNEEAGYGLFTFNLLNGLNGAAKNGSGQVTLQSLYDYVKPKVQDEARRANREQTPQLQSAAPDEFILRAK
jgi:hypothetical protein